MPKEVGETTELKVRPAPEFTDDEIKEKTKEALKYLGFRAQCNETMGTRPDREPDGGIEAMIGDLIVNLYVKARLENPFKE